MKRFMFSLLVSLIFLSYVSASAALASDQFTAKGYKVKADGELEFVVVDSINESLYTFSSEGVTGGADSIVLSNHLGDLVGPESLNNDSLTEYPERMVFSFRLSGSDNANYDITFNVDNFKGIDEKNAGEQIDAVYEMGNRNFVFTNTKDNSSRAGDYTNTGRTSVDFVAVVNNSATPSDSTLRQPLTVRNAAADDYWIFRGAVFLSISETDYDAAMLGNYSTTITATLISQ